MSSSLSPLEGNKSLFWFARKRMFFRKELAVTYTRVLTSTPCQLSATRPHINLCNVLGSSMTKCMNALFVVFVVTLSAPPLTSPLWHWLELYLKVLKNLPGDCRAFVLKPWTDSHLRLNAAIFSRAGMKVNLRRDRDDKEEFLDSWGIRSDLELQRKAVDCLGLFLRDIFLHPGQLWVSL